MSAVTITEVSPRDGLQSHDAHVETDRKVAMIERLVAAGLREIEATSFAHPRVVPRLADAEELMRRLPRRDGVRYRALVPNHKGAVRAVEAGADVLVAFISASPTYSERNQNMTTEQALEQIEGVSAQAHDAGVPWVAAISMAFDSPYEGSIAPEAVLALVERCVALEPEEVYVADTVGSASPERVAKLCAAIHERWPELSLGVHLHGADVRGLDCAVAAVGAGAAQVETSVCGLGGPVVRAPGSERVGNVATEQLVPAFAEHGIDTGLDARAVQRAADDVARLLDLAIHDGGEGS
jgi:hydroxymethylglutaryl-CoA lyase